MNDNLTLVVAWNYKVYRLSELLRKSENAWKFQV